ncbi:MAG: hypothetical protein V1908_00165 [Candidatus Peregrinibacteria bacterium]
MKPSLKKLKEAIWLRSPILKTIMQKHGDRTLYDYAKGFLDVNPAPGLDERKSELIDVVEELLTRRLGKKMAIAVARQLKKNALISTADHHGIICHPFFLNSNIISSLHFQSEPSFKYLIAFSFATISLSNSSHPRSIEFHGDGKQSRVRLKVSLLPDKLKMTPAYAARAIGAEDVQRACLEIDKHQKADDLSPEHAEQIKKMLKKVFLRREVLSAPDFNAQITITNHRLWPLLFDKKPPLPSLIYLEIETVVAEMLIRKHLKNPQSLIHRLLFDPKWAALAQKHFNHIPGGSSHLFWGLNAKNHRLCLKKKGKALLSDDKTFKVDWSPKGLTTALKEKKIFPGMPLCYLMISLYYGMKCLGGFCQVNELTNIKKAWSALLREVGEQKEAQAIKPVQTKELGGDGMVLAYLKTEKGNRIPATGIDLLLQHPSPSFSSYKAFAKKVTLNQMMVPMLPEMFHVLYSADERNPDLIE